jgi:hypothetical protein
MAKTYREGQMITGNALDNRKVPIGTVVCYEPPSGFKGAPSLLTVKGWIRQDGTYARSYQSKFKHWRILHVGNGSPEL